MLKKKFVYFQLSNGNDCSQNEAANNNMEVIFLGQNDSDKTIKNAPTSSRLPNKFSSCKTLQRKLELKVERAKKNFSQNGGTESIRVKFIEMHFFVRFTVFEFIVSFAGS